PVVDAAATFGSCVSTEDGTVNVPAPAVVVQMNVHESEDRLAPVPVMVLEEPIISTRSAAFPPVQFNVNPALSVTAVGSPVPARVKGDPSVSDVLNLPTSLPPAPATVYCPATSFAFSDPGIVIPSVPRLREYDNEPASCVKGWLVSP